MTIGRFITRDRLRLLMLPLASVVTAVALVPIPTSDLGYYVIPWIKQLHQLGLRGISGEFANYTPPYLYLLYLVSGFVPLIPPIALVKALNVPFVAGMSAAVGCVAAIVSGDRERAFVAGAAVWVAPTVLVNAFAWGQADCIYTCFLLWSVLFACIGRPAGAMAFFGVALSFKLQAIFLSPFFLYLFLSRQVRFRDLLWVPAAYLLMMVPAALAGRPWPELLTIYLHQTDTYSRLSLSAPNPWWFIDHWHLLPSGAGTLVGIVLAAAAGLAIPVAALKLERSPANILLVAALSAAAMPYLLPRMHDRYFFIADLLTITLAFARPRLWVLAVLFQIGSLTSYMEFLELSRLASGFAAVPITAGLLLLLQDFREQLASLGRSE